MTDPYAVKGALPAEQSAVEAPSVVFDLDAAIAEREPVAPFTFRFGGEIYTLPSNPDVRSLAAMSAGRLDDALRMMLGADQWTQMQESDAMFDTPALLAMFNAYTEHAGLDLPESPASSKS